MSSIKNSKKNDTGNLLPRRRPRLGKYIALAIGLHVAFVIVYIYFTQRKPEDRSEMETPPVKVVPQSPKKVDLRRHPTESQSSRSSRSARHPLKPSELMSLPDDNNYIPPPHRPDTDPINEFIDSTKSDLLTALARGGFSSSDQRTTRETADWPEKQIAQRNMRVVNLSGTRSATPAPKKPAQPPEPLPTSSRKQLIDLMAPFQASVKRKQDIAMVDPVPSSATHAEPYLPKSEQIFSIQMKKRSLRLGQALPSRSQMTLLNERIPDAQLLVRPPITPATFKFIPPKQGNVLLPKKMHTVAPIKPTLKNFAAQMQTTFPARPESTNGDAARKRMSLADVQMLAFDAGIGPAAPPQHKLSSQPRARLIYTGQILPPPLFSEDSSGSERVWKSKKKLPAVSSLPFPKDLTAELQARKPPRSLQTGKLNAIIQKVNLSRETIGGAVRFEAADKATYMKPRMVWQQYLEPPPMVSSYVPLKPELPQLLEDYLADMVKRLIQPTLQRYTKPMVRVLAKNLTYRDLGLESEGTKFLSGLVIAEIEKQDGVALLSPADVSRDPQVVIEGEMWDDPEKINLRLWSLDRGSGYRIHTTDLSFRRKMLPDKVEIQPPSGENLSIIQRVVELMKRNFPRGGDFQLGVWPDKGLDAVYMEGESLMVYILPEKNAYLHVDYYQIDGKVVHLLPSKNESNYIKAGVPYIIGDPKSGGYEFKVSDPFGEELLVVVASQKKLGAISHGLIEPAEPYIKRLADSLGTQRKKTLMAGSHYIILTKKLDLQK